MKLIKSKCQKCKESFTQDEMYNIETPNHVFEFCLDCAMELEYKLKKQAEGGVE